LAQGNGRPQEAGNWRGGLCPVVSSKRKTEGNHYRVPERGQRMTRGDKTKLWIDTTKRVPAHSCEGILRGLGQGGGKEGSRGEENLVWTEEAVGQPAHYNLPEYDGRHPKRSIQGGGGRGGNQTRKRIKDPISSKRRKEERGSVSTFWKGLEDASSAGRSWGGGAGEVLTTQTRCTQTEIIAGARIQK